jgi:hypothetical protein
VIPFHFYQEHFTQTGANTLIKKLSNTQKQNESICLDIINTISNSPIKNDLLKQQLLSFIKDWKTSGIFTKSSGLIFRSSTNVEDIPGFNGAGLYLSEPISETDCFDWDHLNKTILSIWASVWSLRAVTERQIFGIPQSDVQAAILIQPWLGKSKVLANGVGISKNPFRQDFPAHYLNIQIPGKLVTDGSTGSTPEQILIYDEGKPVTEVITRSSESDKSLLNSHQIMNLWLAMKILHKTYVKKPTSNCIDIEFIVLKDNNNNNSGQMDEDAGLVLLQCRPLTIHV